MLKLFDYLTEEEIKKYFSIKEYASSSIIHNEGDKCEGISFLISGMVLIVTSTYNEKEEIITCINESDFFGDVLCFSNNPFYLGNVICKKKTQILFLPIDNFYKLVSVNQDFLKFMLNEITNKTLDIKNETKLLCHKNIKDRLIYYLSVESKKYNSKEIKIDSVEKLANILSLPRPSVSRTLSILEKEGLIKKIKNTIYIYF